MTFPVVEATAATAGSVGDGGTATTSAAVNLPAGITSGDLLILIHRTPGSATAHSVTGWTQLFNDDSDNSDDRTSAWYREATGSEGSTVTVAQGSSKYASVVYRISGAEDPATQAPQFATLVTGDSATPDPGSLSPTGGAKDYLWLYVAATEGEQGLAPTPPSNYTDTVVGSSGSGGAAATNARIFTWRRSLNAASEDPPSFTMSAGDSWTATVIAIHPAGAAPVTVAAATETDTGGAVTKAKGRTVGGASATDTGGVLTRTKSRTIAAASSTDTGGALAATKSRAVGAATETDTGGTLTKTRTYAVAGATETDTAGAINATGGATYPTLRDFATSSEPTDTTTHTVDLPASVEAGDVLVVMFTIDDVDTITWDNSTFGSWTVTQHFTSATPGNFRSVTARKVATGAEAGGSLSVTTSAASVSVHRSEAWDGAEGSTSIAEAGFASSSTPDPPSLSPAWGSDDVRWLAIVYTHNETTLTSVPSGYGSGASGSVTGAALFRADRATTASSENPGTFTLGSAQGARAVTLAIRGAAAVIEEAIAHAEETDTAAALTRSKSRTVAAASETDTAGAVTEAKSRTVGAAAEADTAGAVTASRTVTVGAASETDSAGAITRSKLRWLNLAGPFGPEFGPEFDGLATLETDTAGTLTRAKSRAIGAATETDTGGSIATGVVTAVDHAEEADTAGALTRAKLATVAAAAETDTAGALTAARTRAVTAAEEADTAGALTRSKLATVGPATETDTAGSVATGVVTAVDQAEEADTAGALTKAKSRAIAEASETDTAGTLTASKVEPAAEATETDTAGAVTASKSWTVAEALEVDTAGDLTRAKSRTVGAASETDTGGSIAISVGQVVAAAEEADTAGSLTKAKSKAVAPAVETDTGGDLAAIRIVPVGAASETDTAGAATEAKSRTVGAASEADTGGALGRSKSKAIGPALTADTAAALAEAKALAILHALEVDTAGALTWAKVRAISPALEVDTAGDLEALGIGPPATPYPHGSVPAAGRGAGLAPARGSTVGAGRGATVT